MCRHEKWIRFCLKQAMKSPVNHYRHSAALVKGGKLISVGYNRNKAGCLGDPCYKYKGWHSELDALINVDPDLIDGAILYVGGWSKGKRIVKSKPCPFCQEFLSKYKLKAIYYSCPEKIYEKMA